MTCIKTDRLELIAATLELSEAELNDRKKFSKLLNANIPPDSPPETAADALPFFLEVLTKFPDWIGWLTWYAVLSAENTLVAGAGFKGAPDINGMVEIGYSVLPKYQRQGIAVEMIEALCKWAFTHDTVQKIEAETTPDNTGSLRVLEKTGFKMIGPGVEAGSIRFVIERNDISQ
jgi:[ribosomal protein S5]-alanine N-acetyltransferase